MTLKAPATYEVRLPPKDHAQFGNPLAWTVHRVSKTEFGDFARHIFWGAILIGVWVGLIVACVVGGAYYEP